MINNSVIKCKCRQSLAVAVHVLLVQRLKDSFVGTVVDNLNLLLGCLALILSIAELGERYFINCLRLSLCQQRLKAFRILLNEVLEVGCRDSNVDGLIKAGF